MRRIEDVWKRIEEGTNETIALIQRLVRQPSVSAEARGIVQTSKLVIEALESVGAKVRVIGESTGFPLVVGDLPGRSDKTLMFYDHYDVQPETPVEKWTHEPFGAELVGDRLYGRGVADNKGDFASRVAVVKAFQEARGELPCRVRFVVEGEEETGSLHLADLAAEHPDVFKADACIWESGGKDAAGRVTLYLGCKGIAYMELFAQGPAHDLHSSMATIVQSPAWRIVHALASLKDPSGNILVPGFFDEVTGYSDEELAMVDQLPEDEEELKRSLGISSFVGGVTGAELKRRHYLGPTCNICGIHAGYAGEGSKTVLPSVASAKVDFRLVPGQEPQDIVGKVEAHLRSLGFTDLTIRWYGNEPAYRTSLDSEFVNMARKCAREVYGGEPVVHLMMAGTGPMHQICGPDNIPVVSLGIGHAGSNIHGPDENIRISDLVETMKYIALIMDEFGPGPS